MPATTDMVQDWLLEGALLSSIMHMDRLVTRELVVADLLQAALAVFDAGPSGMMLALEGRAIGVGYALADDPVWQGTKEARLAVTIPEDRLEQALEVLSWFRFVDGYKVGRNRQILAGHLRGRPLDYLRTLVEGGRQRLSTDAVRKIRQRSLSNIGDELGRRYGFEQGACGFIVAAGAASTSGSSLSA